MLHPDDAAARNLRDGEQVRLVNDRGAVDLMLRVATRCSRVSFWSPGNGPTMRPWPGTVNMLCSDRFTDMGEGATYQSTWLDVRPW